MLKSITTGECTVKHENKASYNKDYIVPDLIEVLSERFSYKILKGTIMQIEKALINDHLRVSNVS